MKRNKILPWVVLLLAALALLYFLNRGCARQRATQLNQPVESAVPGPNGLGKDLGFTSEQVFAYSLDNALQAGEVDPNTVFILDGVSFQERNDVLTPLSAFQLDRFAAILQKYPDVHVRIEGHTDNSGTLRDNLELSRKQALAVREYLKSKGVDSRRVVVVGRGPYKPLTANTTPEGRAKNNRIEVYIVQAPQ